VTIGLALAAVSEGLRVGWEHAVTAEKQKAVLLRELQHRTKNEFALAAAILRLGPAKQGTPSRVGLCHSAQASDSNLVSIQVVCEDVALPPKHANTIGLICNELVTNACKHAFDQDTPGTVLVTLSRSNSLLALAVEDDGKGCPEDANEGVGSQVIRLLVAQLEGHVARQPIEKGCRVSVFIPETSLQ